jgi:hypothetical protein
MTVYQSNYFTSTRSIEADRSRNAQAVRLRVNGTSENGVRVDNANVAISFDDAVSLAKDLLRLAGREDLLARPKLGEQVGKYYRHVTSGRLVRITGPATGSYVTSDYAMTVRQDGTAMKIHNEYDVTNWEPVEVEVIPATEEKWVVK